MVCDNLNTMQRGNVMCDYQIELNTLHQTKRSCPKQTLKGSISPNCWRYIATLIAWEERK